MHNDKEECEIDSEVNQEIKSLFNYSRHNESKCFYGNSRRDT